MQTNKKLMIIMALGCLAAVSCQKEGVRVWLGESITAEVSTQDPVTKAVAAPTLERVISLGEVNGHKLDLEVYVSDNTESIPDNCATKGAFSTTGTMNHTGQSFSMHGYLGQAIATSTVENVDPLDKTDFHFIGGTSAGEKLVYIGDNTTHKWDWDAATKVTGSDADKDAARPKWRANIISRFWAYYPSTYFDESLSVSWPHVTSGTETPTDAQQVVTSFSYTLPTSSTSAPYKDAEAQNDLLIAYGESNYKDKNTSSSSLSIHFYHLLAAVNFDITTVDETVEFAADPSITFKHVRYSGDCTVTGTSIGSPSTSAGTAGVVWSNLSTDFKSFSQTFDKDDDFETSGSSIVQKKSGAKTFFMIPQTLSSAVLSVQFEFKNGGVPVAIDAPLEADVWQAGKVYTYRLKVGGDDYTLLDATLDPKEWIDGNAETSF